MLNRTHYVPLGITAATLLAAPPVAEHADIDAAMSRAAGLLHAAGNGDNITGVTSELVDFSDGFVLDDGTIFPLGAAEVAAEWAEFRQAWRVFRLWATVDGPDATVGGVGGSTTNGIDLILGPGLGCEMYNHPTFWTDHPPNPAIALADPRAVFDTWVTIGTAVNGNQALITDPDNAFDGFTSASSCQNCGWTTTPVSGGGVVQGGSSGWRVLLGQFTMPRNTSLDFSGSVAGGGQIVYDGFDGVSPSCPDRCPWDCAPPLDPDWWWLEPGNGEVNIDDLFLVVNAIATQNLDCDVAPDHGNGAFGDFDVDIDDLLATIDNGPCP